MTLEEAQALSKKYSAHPVAPPATPIVPAPNAPDAPATPPAETKPEEPPELSGAGETNLGVGWPSRHDITRGLSHGAADLATGAGTVVGDYMLPSLGQLARQYLPEGAKEQYRRLERYSAEPSEEDNWTESISRFAGANAPLMALAGPEEAAYQAISKPVGNFLTRLIASYLPRQVATKGPKFMTPGLAAKLGLGGMPGKIPRTSAIKARKIGRRAGAVTGAVGAGAPIGALSGAIGSPEDPTAGAVTGAALGPAGRGAGAAMSSKGGRWFGKYGLPEAAFMGARSAAEHMGYHLPFYPIAGPLITWHYGPVGGPLRRIGDKIMDKGGRIVGTINPATAGHMGASASPITREMIDAAREQNEQQAGQ